jgi:hypothetical protein
MTQKLMLIPIVHSEKETGSLKSDISDLIDRKFTKENRDQPPKDVAPFWDNLRTIINSPLAIRHNALFPAPGAVRRSGRRALNARCNIHIQTHHLYEVAPS